MRKRCTLCQIVKPWSDFYPHTKWDDGSMRLPQSRCIPCSLAIRAEQKRRQRQDPTERERLNASQRAYYAQYRDLNRGTIRDYSREWNRRNRGSGQRRRLRTVPPATRSIGLPIGPFAHWLRTLDDSTEQIALRTGMSPRMVYTIIKGEYANVEVDTVDRALLAVGDGTTIDSLYPNVSLAA